MPHRTGRARSFLAALSVVAAVVVLPACRSAPPPTDLRERAYRANNRGIAHLERFEYPEAAAAFRDALAIDGGLAIARLNLSIALLYALDLSGAERDASEAARLLPEAPQPPYIRGLIARAENRPADARREFERVRQIDAGDVGTNVNLGQILLEERRYEEAIPLLRAAADAEAVNVTAIYNLGLALTRAGREAEGRDMLARAQALRSVGYSITYGNGYLEQGAYAEAIGSTGAEPGLVDARVPRNSFRSSIIAPMPGAAGGGVALIDADGDSDLDLFVASGAGERLFENQGQGGWRDLTSATGLAERRGGIGAAAADFDNDGRADLLVLRQGGSALYRNEGDGRFSDVTAAAGLQKIPYYPAAGAWADIDHDGDADLVVSGQEAADGQRRPRKPGELDTPSSYVTVALQVFRNNGNGTFAEIAAASGLGAVVRAVAIAPTDFDNRRDLDLLVANAAGAPLLFRNLRDGRFRDDAAGAGLADILGAIRVTAMATGDINKDDFPDFFFAGEPNGVFAMSDGRGRFRAMPAPDGAAGAAAQLFDYDNDGLLDLLVSAEPGTRLWRNTAAGWNEVTASALTGAAKAGAWSPRGVAIADLDRNGTSDIVMLTAGNVGVLLNDGDPDRRAQRVQLKGRVSNRLGHRRQGAAPRRKPQHARGDVGGHADGGARRHRVRPGQPAVCRRRARAVALRHPSIGNDAIGRTRRTCPPVATCPRSRGARSQTVVLSVPVHMERRAVRVRHRLPRRGRDGLLGGAGRAQRARSARSTCGSAATSFAPATGAWSCASRTSSRRRCSSTACSCTRSLIRRTSRSIRTKG